MTIYNLKWALLYIFASSSFYSAIASDDLDAVLLRDIMPSRGSKCEAGANSYTGQTSSYTFQHYPSPSYWDPTAAPFEPQVFQAEMSNVNAADPDKSWTIRVGRGGNIYSFRGPFFEAIPPQYHTDGEWVDEVTQSVAVNLAQNGDSDYYMHQAGIYTKDGPHTDQPFFSPSIAQHCSDKECFFASWGQQAHTPTKHISNTIYFNGYRDCGDGILEFTTIIHNSANSPNLYTDYHNTPWGGTRSTNLRDIFISSPDGSMSQKYPLANWSNDPNTIQNLNSSGGYTTFTQQVVVEESVYNSRPPYQMPVSNGVSLELTVNGNAVKSNWHSDTYGLHCMRLPVIATFGTGAGCSFCNFELENARTGAKVFVPAVIHWSWQGTNMYLCLPRNSVSSQFNNKFNPGDKILVAYANIGKPYSENKALSVIHGKQRAWGEWSPTNRVRYGVAASSARRNYNVYTTNTRRKIRPGSTYIYTQYIASGRLLEMESTGNAWEPQVYEDIYDETEKIGDGTTIQLYSADMNTFGAYVDGVNQCLQGSSVCTGNSLPEFNKIPLFYITCGSNTYVGSNKYHFSPPRANINQNIRSYVCNGENANVRPTWKLLGYFEDESCSALQAATYDATFCPRPPPTESPTGSPTLSPTGSPTLSPTESPTGSPTLSPTGSPTSSPTESPTGSPTPSTTKSPTGSPTLSPTGSPTLSPTKSPTGSPTLSPTESPTGLPTPSPTGSPTGAPTEETECNADESYFSIEIKLDRKGHQNVASLQKKDEVTGKWVKIFRVNTFGTNQLFQWGQCMNKNTCYRFNIADSARDGICCEHGQGYFEVKFDDQRKFDKFKKGRRRRRTIGDCGSNKNGNFTDFGTDDFDDDFDDGLGSEGTEVSALKSYDFFGTLSKIFDAIVELLLALVGSTP